MQNIPGFEEYQKQLNVLAEPSQEKAQPEQKKPVQESINNQNHLLKNEIKALTLWPRLKNSSTFWYLLGLFTFASATTIDLNVAKTLQHDFDSPFFNYNLAIQGSVLGIGALLALAFVFMATERTKNISADKIFRNIIQLRDHPFFASSDAASLKELNELGLRILKKCSGIDPKFIENLKNGEYDHTIDYSQAIAIIEGYLTTHPKEKQEILNAFNKSQLPKSILEIFQATDLRDEVHNANPAIVIQQTKGM